MKNKIYIVGAHSRGRTFKEYVMTLWENVSVEAFLVDDLDENDKEVDGIPVLEINKKNILYPECPVYIATRGVYHNEIKKELISCGIMNIYPVDVELDIKLRNEYVRKKYAMNNKEFLCVPEDDNSYNEYFEAQIYVATSIYDKALNSAYTLTQDEKVIQVGTALSDERIPSANSFDNEGDNISFKNKQYCELTALYWMWKNSTADVIGLVHYRRHFILPEGWSGWMKEHDIDIILPVPLYVGPSIQDNYKHRHDEREWNYMLEYLRKHNPEDYEPALKFFEGTLYSPCNMFIMKREILNELCAWLFPILEAVVSFSGEKEDKYQNRYPGFLSERLITYFCECKKKEYKVAYANKNFLN